MQLTIVRHGETDWNVAGKIMGHTDIPLNEVGQRQADRVARRLAGEKFDVIVTSDLRRAGDTARAIACYHPAAAFIEEPRFRERSAGVFQGLTRADTQEKFPEVLALIGEDPRNARIPGGETRSEMEERVSTALNELITGNRGRRVLLVTHGGVIQRIVDLLNERGCSFDPRTRFVNTCIIQLDFSGDVPVITVACDSDHLEECSTDDNGHFQV